MAINAERDIKAGQRDITVRQILERMKGKVTEKVIMEYPEGFNRTSPSDHRDTRSGNAAIRLSVLEN